MSFPNAFIGNLLVLLYWIPTFVGMTKVNFSATSNSFLSIYFKALISLACAPTGAYFVPVRLEQSGNPDSSGLRQDQDKKYVIINLYLNELS